MASKRSDSVATTKKVEERTEERLLESRTLTKVERLIFETQTTEERLEYLGAQTRSAAVLSESRAWLVPMQKALAKEPEDLFYSEERFTFFLEVIAALNEKIASQKAVKGSAERARGIKDIHLTQLRKKRKQLLAALSSMARGNEVLENEVAIARGDTETDDTLLDSTRALIKLARLWLEKESVRARLAKLNVKLVDEADEAVSQLAGATDQRREEGRVIVRDDRSTNRAEGRVLVEMKAAMRAFDEARELGALVPRLVPGPGTRRVLVGKGAKSDPEPTK